MLLSVLINPYIFAEKDQTAYFRSDRFDTLNFEKIPSWNSLDDLQSRFEEIRDKKFLIYNNKKRRIPWLFAKDGCHNRAALFINQAVKAGYRRPMRIFIFGILEIKSPYIVGGSVRPWFHSAPIIKVDNDVYVLDPGLDLDRPMLLKDWASYLTTNLDQANIALCSGDTYLPTSLCDSPKVYDERKIFDDAQLYLKLEWNTLNYLGFSPAELLL